MSLTIIPYDQIEKDKWNQLVKDSPHGWWWHTTQWIDYVDCREDHRNLSFAIADGSGEYIRIDIMFLQKDQIQMEGEPCPVPLGMTDHPENARVGTMVYEEMIRLWNIYQWTRYRVRYAIPLKVMGAFNTEMPIESIGWKTQVVALPAPWSDVRKSYRPLITRAQRIHGIRVFAKPSEGLGQGENEFDGLEEFHTLHRKAKGKETRPIGTWAAMYDWIISGNGIVCLVGKPAVAGAYFIRYKGLAYYASGASIKPDCQHAAVWGGIDYLSRTKVTEVELGWHARPWDEEKAKSIAFFKTGFGGEARWISSCII